MSFIVSLDPGAKGAAAFFHYGQLQKIISFHKGDWRTDLFLACKFEKPEIAVIEEVHSWSGQGVKSMFSFGERNGEIKTILHLADIPIQLIRPQEWQRRLGLLRQGKAAHKELALKLFPQLKGVKEDIWDAVLIGYAAGLAATPAIALK